VSGDEPADPHPPAEAVREAVGRALAEDLLPLGDLTGSLVPADALGAMVLVARQPGVLAGRACVDETVAQLGGRVRVLWHRAEGSTLSAGEVVAELSGPLRDLLAAERTLLNFVSHLSGIATVTRRFVDAVQAVDPAVRVLDTRKTTPGLRALEKAAVRAGGGHNHRASLSDAVLVKDNHLGALGIADAVRLAQARWPGRLVEIECDRIEQVDEACRAGATAVLLDNMSPADVARCVGLVRSSAPPRPLIEVSGGVTLETAPGLAAAGPDLISVGALTHSAPVLDFGLDLRPAGGARG
jgi:nicotinate-nucleotide pyrophosphorylase (carboxylating)